MNVLVGNPNFKELSQINADLRHKYLKNFSGSEEQRLLFESKFKEIEDVIAELKRSLVFIDSLEKSPQSEEISILMDRFNEAELKLENNRNLHQRQVRQVQNEINSINVENIEMKKQIGELDQQLGINQGSPNNQEIKPPCCENCVIS